MQLAQWGFGSFSGVTWQRLRLFAPLTIAGVLVAAATTKQLNALLLGENYARSMGVAVRRARLLTMFGASILGAVVTAFCGPIAFLGIAIPHSVPRPAGDIESSCARPGRRADGRRRRAGCPGRVASARQCRNTAAECRDLHHRCAGGRCRSAAQPDAERSPHERDHRVGGTVLRRCGPAIWPWAIDAAGSGKPCSSA